MNTHRTIAFALVLSACGITRAAEPQAERPNVLFIAADDLRNDLGCYDHSEVKTPHLDALAARSVLFRRAYCQQAVCNPSRASLLTGRRPDTLRLWNLEDHFRETAPGVVTLPQWFKQHGYFTQGIGKIFHNWRTRIKGDPRSWSVPASLHFARHGDDKPKVAGELPPNLAKDVKCEQRDVPDQAYYDGRVAAEAIKALRARKAAGQPFFLAVGFWKPHSPFNAPKRYWDLYERAAIAMPSNPQPPQDVPEVALHNSREILGVPARKLTEDAVREIRHGYLANISYLDAQVGKVLDELERSGLKDKTIVVFWSDHGYHLGEHSLWAKTSNFELDARVPLLIAAPGVTTRPTKTDALVELLDLFPTLTELCNLPTPRGLDGVSLAPVLSDHAATVRNAAVSQHPRPAYYKGQPQIMGYSVRTERYRYTEWRDWKTGQAVARELYDHEKDSRETVNRAGPPGLADEVRLHEALLHAVAPRSAATRAALMGKVPGVVIDYSPASSGLYVGSPSITVLPEGDYLASHDFFGPKSAEHECPKTAVFRSSDRGMHWQQAALLECLFWNNLFTHRGAAYLMGPDKHHGRIVIRRSTDGGRTWTEPRDTTTGLLTAEGQYHTAPMPVLEHDGRLWRAFEDAMGGTQWGKRYRAMMLSVPVDADLLNAASWTFSNHVTRDAIWLDGKFNAWLEGNAVLTRAGEIVNILRVDTPACPEKAAIVKISSDGKQASFDPVTGFIDFPGGAKKFTIRFDAESELYWSLATMVHERHQSAGRPGGIRNTLALVSSPNLRQWEVRTILLYHPDVKKHGFQYPDWHFEGDDIIAAVRTAYDDGSGGARNNHDANFLTFHRILSFRKLTMADSVPIPK